MDLRYRYLLFNLLLALAPLLFSVSTFAQEGITEAKIIQQSLGRDFGVLVGDTIEHHYIIDVPADFSLSPASLPARDNLNYWLKIVSVTYHEIAIENKRKHYQLDIVFQTFYAPLDVRVLLTPEINVSFYHGDTELRLSVPAWPFTMSPLKESSAAGDNPRAFMKPDLQVISIDNQKLKLQAYGLGLAIFIMTLLWLVLSGRLFNSVQSPFQQAARQIKTLQRQRDRLKVEQAIDVVHKAFNSQAKYAVFSHQIESFIDDYPEFSSNKQKMEKFYKLSIDVLYGQQQATLDHFEQLLDLCRSMAKSERLALKK